MSGGPLRQRCAARCAGEGVDVVHRSVAAVVRPRRGDRDGLAFAAGELRRSAIQPPRDSDGATAHQVRAAAAERDKGTGPPAHALHNIVRPRENRCMARLRLHVAASPGAAEEANREQLNFTASITDHDGDAVKNLTIKAFDLQSPIVGPGGPPARPRERRRGVSRRLHPRSDPSSAVDARHIPVRADRRARQRSRSDRDPGDGPRYLTPRATPAVRRRLAGLAARDVLSDLSTGTRSST